MTKTQAWILANRANGTPTVTGNDATFRLTERTLPELKAGEVLLKLKYLSNDPAQRGWIAEGADHKRSYIPPVQVGEAMRAGALAEIVETKSQKYKKGDDVIVTAAWTRFAIFNENDLRPAPELPDGLSKTHYLGALGFTGFTAYYGIKEIVRTTADDIVVVSGAAGATGSMVVQIAKKLIGCKRVIGIAGSDDKCKWVESLGADVCVNYKSSDFKNRLIQATEGFATVYFDNVGGEILDLVITRLAKYGRIAACGSISNYNLPNDKKVGIKNWSEIVTNRLEVRGFIVLDYAQKFGETTEIFRKAIKDGKLTIDEKSEHVVKTEFADIPKTWLKLFEGENVGKLITAIQ